MEELNEKLNVEEDVSEIKGEDIKAQELESEVKSEERVEEVKSTDETVIKDFFIKDTGISLKEMAILFGQTEEELSKEFGAFKAQKLYSKMDFLIDETVVSFEEFKKKCMLAKKYNFKSVTVMPTFLGLAKDLLRGKNIKVRCVISYPFGEDIGKVKYYAVKRAIKLGADEILFVVSPREVKYGNYKVIVKMLKRVVKLAKKRPVTAILPIKNISNYEMQKISRMIAKDVKLYSVMPFSYGEEKVDYQSIIKDALTAVNGKCYVEYGGNVETALDGVSIFSLGANGITSKNCPIIANELNIKILEQV